MLDPKTVVANFATKFKFPPKDETERQRGMGGYMRLQGMSGNATMLADGWMEGFLQQSEASPDRSAWRIPRQLTTN